MIIFSRWTNLRKSAHFSGISVARIAGSYCPSLHDDETAPLEGMYGAPSKTSTTIRSVCIAKSFSTTCPTGINQLSAHSAN
jgi:hypothetical protein